MILLTEITKRWLLEHTDPKPKSKQKTCYPCSYDKYSWIDNELFTLFLCQVQLKEAADCLHQSADVLRHDSDMAETLDRRRRLFQKLGAE